MNLKSQRELENTKRKLEKLKSRQTELLAEKDVDHDLRDAELQSISRTINQFKEEIARFEAHQPLQR